MKRILVISDIHGNYPALEAVAELSNAADCDYIVNCGDSTVYAPFPNQVLEWLTANHAVSIQGNTDHKVCILLKGKKFKKPGKEEKRIMYTHTAGILSRLNRERLISFKKKNRLEVEGTTIKLFHGSPESKNEFLFPSTPDERFSQLARSCKADIIITGHSHTPYQKIINNTLFINPGSVGRMFDGNPEASFILLDIYPAKTNKQPQVTFFRCKYDIERVVKGLKEAGLPDIYSDMYRSGRKLN